MIETMWILYTVFGLVVFSLAFVWAVRTRQFRHQDRARFLPLEAEGAVEEAYREPASVVGAIIVGFIAVVAFGLLAATVFLAQRGAGATP